MLLSERIKPISYLKANAADILDKLPDDGPLVVTVHGEARAVIMDVAEYEELQWTIELLRKLLASEQDLQAGRVRPIEEAFADLRNKKRRPRG